MNLRNRNLYISNKSSSVIAEIEKQDDRCYIYSVINLKEGEILTDYSLYYISTEQLEKSFHRASSSEEALFELIKSQSC